MGFREGERECRTDGDALAAEYLRYDAPNDHALVQESAVSPKFGGIKVSRTLSSHKILTNREWNGLASINCAATTTMADSRIAVQLAVFIDMHVLSIVERRFECNSWR
jgi:hypothetical protein